MNPSDDEADAVVVGLGGWQKGDRAWWRIHGGVKRAVVTISVTESLHGRQIIRCRYDDYDDPCIVGVLLAWPFELELRP